MWLNDNVDLISTYFNPFHLVLHFNYCQNIFADSPFVKSIWFYYVVKFWNFLPDNVKQCNIHRLFCNHLKFVNYNNLLKYAAAHL